MTPAYVAAITAAAWISAALWTRLSRALRDWRAALDRAAEMAALARVLLVRTLLALTVLAVIITASRGG